jgi:hypothetical protein
MRESAPTVRRWIISSIPRGRATFAAGAEMISSSIPVKRTNRKGVNRVTARPTTIAAAVRSERVTTRTMPENRTSRPPNPRMTLASTSFEISPCNGYKPPTRIGLNPCWRTIAFISFSTAPLGRDCADSCVRRMKHPHSRSAGGCATRKTSNTRADPCWPDRARVSEEQQRCPTCRITRAPPIDRECEAIRSTDRPLPLQPL